MWSIIIPNLQNEATLIYDDALDLDAAVVTAQHMAQETILSFNMTSDSAQSLLQANIPSWEYAVNLSGLINGSSVPSGDVVALALNASSVKAAADLLLMQALNIRYVIRASTCVPLVVGIVHVHVHRCMMYHV